MLAGAGPRDPTYLIILGQPQQFSAELPRSAPGRTRRVGWGTVQYTLSTPAAELRRNVEAALDATEQSDYPLLLHRNDWNFPPPSTDPDWVEWTGFPKPGETHGPLVRRRWLNWGAWMVTGPPPNYESPRFRAFMRSQLDEGVVKPLAARLARWRKEGRAGLFAGLGWAGSRATTRCPRSPRQIARALAPRPSATRGAV